MSISTLTRDDEKNETKAKKERKKNAERRKMLIFMVNRCHFIVGICSSNVNFNEAPIA